MNIFQKRKCGQECPFKRCAIGLETDMFKNVNKSNILACSNCKNFKKIDTRIEGCVFLTH